MDIPQEYIEVCKEFGKVARKHHLTEIHGDFKPPWQENRQINRIDFTWNAGRHEADTGNISIHADTWVATTIDDK